MESKQSKTTTPPDFTEQAPERIWIPVEKLRVGFWGSILKDGVEYVRADLNAPGIAHEELAREQIVQAITDIQEARLSHLHWAEYFEAHPEAEKQYESTGEWDNAKVHREWVEKYDNMLAILARFPFAYLKATTPQSPNRDYTKHPEVWLRERGQQ